MGPGAAMRGLLEGASDMMSLENFSPAGAEAGLLALLTRGKLGRGAAAAEEINSWVRDYGKFNNLSTEALGAALQSLEKQGGKEATIRGGEYLREILERAVYDKDPVAQAFSGFSGEQDDLAQMLNRIDKVDFDLQRLLPERPPVRPVTEEQVRAGASRMGPIQAEHLKRKAAADEMRLRPNTNFTTQAVEEELGWLRALLGGKK